VLMKNKRGMSTVKDRRPMRLAINDRRMPV
jgi:hypothetical protein